VLPLRITAEWTNIGVPFNTNHTDTFINPQHEDLVLGMSSLATIVHVNSW